MRDTIYIVPQFGNVATVGYQPKSIYELSGAPTLIIPTKQQIRNALSTRRDATHVQRNKLFKTEKEAIEYIRERSREQTMSIPQRFYNPYRFTSTPIFKAEASYVDFTKQISSVDMNTLEGKMLYVGPVFCEGLEYQKLSNFSILAASNHSFFKNSVQESALAFFAALFTYYGVVSTPKDNLLAATLVFLIATMAYQSFIAENTYKRYFNGTAKEICAANNFTNVALVTAQLETYYSRDDLHGELTFKDNKLCCDDTPINIGMSHAFQSSFV